MAARGKIRQGPDEPTRLGKIPREPAPGAGYRRMMTEHLPHLDLGDAQRILCVAAHPDDLEYGTSAAVAAWTEEGHAVTYLLLTRGEAGIRGLPPHECGPVREREQVAGSRAVGVTDVRFLTEVDGQVAESVRLRQQIAGVIRKTRPDVVVTPTWELEVPWGLNHADHRACGMSVVDAIRDADNPWVFPELAAEGLEPWAARDLLVAAHGEPNCVVDVSGEPLERAIASLEAHEVYFAALPEHPAPREFLTQMTSAAGPLGGCEHAVAFRRFAMG